MAEKLSPEDERFFFELAKDPARKIEAIKLYRERTGVSLAEAKEAIEDFETASAPRQPVRAEGTLEMTLILHALQRQGKIDAIREYRRQTGCGLRDARLAVEKIAREQGIKPRSGCLSVVAAAALLLSLLWLVSSRLTLSGPL